MSTKSKQEVLEHYAQRYRSAGRSARSRKYGADVHDALTRLWNAAN